MMLLRIGRLYSKRSCGKNIYAKSLMLTEVQQFEHRILCLVWLILMITAGYVFQQGWMVFLAPTVVSALTDNTIIQRPLPNQMRFSGAQPSSGAEETSAFTLPSLFHLALKAEPSASPVNANDLAQSLPSAKSQTTPPARWVMQIQRAPILSPSTSTLFEEARLYLRQGTIEQAQCIYTQVLQQDPHQLQALVGMLYISQMRADNEQYAHYLQRVQQLIPDIEANPALFAQVLEDE